MGKDLAVVTGASSGIGYQLARRAVEDGWPILAVADEDLEPAAGKLRRLGGTVETLVTDLASRDGRDALWDAVGERDLGLFFANAGRALGHAFHDQRWEDVDRLIALNVKQTTAVLHEAGRRMTARGRGRILVSGSIGGDVPGPFDAVYDATKAYLNSLAYALADEWRDSGVTVTCLMPGPVDTPIFERAGMGDTPIARSDAKDDPAEVARAGYDAMMRGETGVAPGLGSSLVRMLSGIVPDEVLAAIHRRGAEPGR